MRVIQLFCFLISSLSSFGEEENVAIALDPGDARFLFDAMKQVDRTEWFQILHHSKMVDVRRDLKEFRTRDGSMIISCSAEMFLGSMNNYSCSILLDKTQLKNGNVIEEKAAGLFYGFMNDRTDAIAFYERILKPLLSFQTMEKVPVRKNDGTYLDWYRLYMTCSMENDGPYLKIPRACTISGVRN